MKRWSMPSFAPVRAIAKVAGIVAVVGAIAIIVTRSPDTSAFPVIGNESYTTYPDICRMQFGGNEAGAHAALKAMLPDEPGDGLEAMCQCFLINRARCRSGLQPDLEDCRAIESAIGAFTESPDITRR